MTSAKFPVYLRVYDISDGAASIWSPIVLWKRLEGIWHTGIQAYGFEYFYGGSVLKMYPHDVEESYNMKPVEVIHLGYTSMTQAEFERFLDEISQDFNRDTYDLIKWNCNTFSNTCAKYLLDKGIPDKITELPAEINRTLMGNLIIKAMKAMRGTPPVDADAVAESRSERIAHASRNRGRHATIAPCSQTLPKADRPRRFTCPSVRMHDENAPPQNSSSQNRMTAGHSECSRMAPVPA